MKPSIGRIVHYVEPGRKEPRAAIITDVRVDERRTLGAMGDGVLVDLETFGHLKHQHTGVRYDERGAEHTWHWPPRVEG